MTSSPNVHLVGAVADSLDRRCRADLHASTLNDERQYVASLTTRIRDYWAFHGLPCFAFSKALPSTQEQRFGCDALILLRLGGKAKVCLFEAKWPRMLNGTYKSKWDHHQKNGNSHFSDQLIRQSKWAGQAAIWELIMLEQKPGVKFNSFDRWASTCVLHEEAYLYDRANRKASSLWTQAELDSMVSFARHKPKNIRTMLTRAAACKIGEYTPVTNGYAELRSDDFEEVVGVPSDLETAPDAIAGFCEENGIEHFLMLQIE